MEDPLEVVAGEISDEAILLCLDEFMVENWYLHLCLKIIYGYLCFGVLISLWSLIGD